MSPGAVTGLFLPITAVLIAWAGTLLFRSVAPARPLSLVLFFAAVALCAGIGGLRAGVLATLLSALTCDYFFLTPFHSFAVAATDVPLLILFLIAALLINGVSDRLRAQAKYADQRFYQLVQGLDGIVWEVNPRTLQFTFVSQRAEMLLGYSIRQWHTDPDFRTRITHPEDHDRMRALWQKALAEGGEHAADYRAITADDRELWLRETVYVVHDPNGRPLRMTGLGIDITERKFEAGELTRMKDEFAVLNEINAALSSSLELSAFIEILRTHLQKHLGISAGCLYLAEDADKTLRFVDAWGVPDDLVSDGKWLKLSPPAPPPGRERISSEPAATTPRVLSGSPISSELASLALSEVLILPLLAEDELRGALCLFRSAPFRLEGNHAVFYATLGRQIGTLLQNVNLFQEVRVGRERLHQLSRQLVNVQEAERRAIARELHDEVGQVLTGVKLSLEMSVRLTGDALAAQVQQALVLVRELMVQIEGLSLDLRPAMLDDLGLLPALLWHCKRYTALTGIHVQFEHNGLECRFPAEIEITVYRIVQEALTNVARHADVNEVNVRVWSTFEMIALQVADDGVGFDVAAVTAGKPIGGLTGMEERTTLLGGNWVVETAPGAGTCITVDLPLKATLHDPIREGDTLLTMRKHEK